MTVMFLPTSLSCDGRATSVTYPQSSAFLLQRILMHYWLDLIYYILLSAQGGCGMPFGGRAASLVAVENDRA